LRNAQGQVHICLTRNRAHFPDCKADPSALKHSMSAGQGQLKLRHVPPGDYALAVVHDENSNGRLDTIAKIPREGFGFSRNPAIRFGAPSFKDVRFSLHPGTNGLVVRMRYLL